ncbi:MAG: Hsp33 family molecular chaperone HslO [Leptospiraceae bacterium]|nr:Hsp33 family molecular chaperone HslO [Leptospiraceae bacterium]
MNAIQNKDSYIVGIFSRYNFRFLITDCSNSVIEAVRRHKLEGSSLILAAKTMIGSFFLAGMVKEDTVVSIQLEGDGEIERVIGYSNRVGLMRVLAKNTSVNSNSNDPTFGIGTGIFRVTRWGGVKKLHQSLTKLEKKSFESNLLDHIQESDQITSFLSIHIDALGEMVYAKGMILYALPGTELFLIEELFEKLNNI